MQVFFNTHFNAMVLKLYDSFLQKTEIETFHKKNQLAKYTKKSLLVTLSGEGGKMLS